MKRPVALIGLLICSLPLLAQYTQDAERHRVKYGRLPAHIEHSEWQRAWKSRAKTVFSRLDKDGNGAITRKEWEKERAWLSRIDRNSNHDAFDHDKDGVITASEWSRTSTE